MSAIMRQYSPATPTRVNRVGSSAAPSRRVIGLAPGRKADPGALLELVCRTHSWVIRKAAALSVRARMHWAYALWAVTCSPALWEIGEQIEQWDIYRVCLLTAGLGWFGGIHYYECAAPPRRAPVPSLVGLGLLMGTAAVAVSGDVPLASCLAVLSLLMVRLGMTGETLIQAVRAGALLTVFIVVVPLEQLEQAADLLTELHAPAMVSVTSWLIGLEAFREGTAVHLTPIHAVYFIRECAGLTSLLGLLVIGLYCGARERLGFRLSLLLAIVAGTLAIACNFLRVTASGVFKVAEYGFWVSGPGHELLGLLLLALAVTLINGMSKRLLLPEEESVRPSAGTNRSGVPEAATGR